MPLPDDELMTQMRGFAVADTGTYVLLDDVVTVLRQYAQSFDDPNAGALIHRVASWISGGETPLALEVEEPENPTSAFGSEAGDDSLDVGRIEVFPDPPNDPRPKWYARSIDTGGHIMRTSNGSYDFEWVVKNAEERWPGIEIHLLQNAGEDSKWTEDSTRGVFPSQGPPIRRLYNGTPS